MSVYLKSTKQIWQVQGFKILSTKIKKSLFWSDHNTDLKKIIKQYSPDYEFFIDIGANVGSISLDAAPYFSTCIAFEPTKKNYNKFIRKIKERKINNITTKNCALGEKKGKSKLYSSSDNQGDNRFFITPNEKFDCEEVAVYTLDEILQDLGINEKCIIKIDVQGAELEVMKGGRQILEKNCIIVSEFWPWGLNINNSEPSEYVNYMNSLGYHFFDLNGYPIQEKYLHRLCSLGKNKRYVSDDFLIKKV